MRERLWLWLFGWLALSGVGCGDDAGPPGETLGGVATPMGPTAAGDPGVGPGAGVGGAPQPGMPGPGVQGPGGQGPGVPGPGPAMDPAPGPGDPAPVVGMDAGTPAPSDPMPDAGPDTPAGDCDRACLIGFMQRYIDALIAQDPSQLPVSADLKYTENGVVSELGDTVWQTADSLVADTRLDFADPQEGQVASHFVFNEGSTPVIYQVRLKVEADAITEIETMAVRERGAANGFFNVANMKPEPVFLQEPSDAERASREELIDITNQYLDYLEGDRRGQEVPFDADCKRYENGQVTASGVGSFNSQSFWRFDVTRRILVVDEAAGITWGMFPFSQSNTALVVGEAFKIFGGKIMMIQAVMANQPAKAWD